jgi:hypothetical protein
MTTEIDDAVEEGQSSWSPDEIIAALRVAILTGEPWYPALLEAVGRWRLPEERSGGRLFTYLVAGEAFDWLLLAERLADAIADLIPAAERDDLLFFNRPPGDQDPDEFRRLIGPAKYRAHLNYLYGVIVEEALQLAVEEELHKENRCRVWNPYPQVEEAAFERIYGRGRTELLAAFRAERGVSHAPVLALTELREFTYWLFKLRMKTCDPARVASDTRRGLAQLSRLESGPLRYRPRSAPVATADGEDIRGAQRSSSAASRS